MGDGKKLKDTEGEFLVERESGLGVRVEVCQNRVVDSGECRHSVPSQGPNGMSSKWPRLS